MCIRHRIGRRRLCHLSRKVDAQLGGGTANRRRRGMRQNYGAEWRWSGRSWRQVRSRRRRARRRVGWDSGTGCFCNDVKDVLRFSWLRAAKRRVSPSRIFTDGDRRRRPRESVAWRAMIFRRRCRRRVVGGCRRCGRRCWRFGRRCCRFRHLNLNKRDGRFGGPCGCVRSKQLAGKLSDR